mgnify:CR=1 FL=1
MKKTREEIRKPNKKKKKRTKKKSERTHQGRADEQT